MTREEIESTSTILILGGSETSATLLSAATYYLLTHPHVMQKLVQEIRGEFKKEQEINMLSVSQLPYLQAVIKEALRIFPPVTLGSPRVVEGNGKAIGGIMVPSGVRIPFSQNRPWNFFGSCIVSLLTRPCRQKWLQISTLLRARPITSWIKRSSCPRDGWMVMNVTPALKGTRGPPASHSLLGAGTALGKSMYLHSAIQDI